MRSDGMPDLDRVTGGNGCDLPASYPACTLAMERGMTELAFVLGALLADLAKIDGRHVVVSNMTSVH